MKYSLILFLWSRWLNSVYCYYTELLCDFVASPWRIPKSSPATAEISACRPHKP